jgi:hypothetical protein
VEKNGLGKDAFGEFRDNEKGESFDSPFPCRIFEDPARPDRKPTLVYPRLFGTCEQARLSLTFPSSRVLDELSRCHLLTSSFLGVVSFVADPLDGRGLLSPYGRLLFR